MSEQKHTEKSIEKLLYSTPKVQDERTKDEVLQRLLQDDRLHEKKARKKRSLKWLIPAATSIAAICLLAILIPTMMKSEKDFPMKASMEDQSRDPGEQIEERATVETEEKSVFNTKSMDDHANLSKEIPHRFALFESDVQNVVPFSIGLADEQAYSIPVTILLPNELVEKDLGKGDVSEVQLYNEYAAKLDEIALGFTEYHPYKATVSEEDQLVHVDLQPNHGYDIGSASLTAFLQSLMDAFGKYDSVVLRDEKKEPAYLSEVGTASPIIMNEQANHYAYFVYTQQSGQQYLMSGGREQTVEEALIIMKEKPNDDVQSAIPSSVDYAVETSKDVVTISFTKPLNLESIEKQQVSQMIDAILLTAASFNKQVFFQNVIQDRWNEFDFTKPLPMPIGPNPIEPIFK